MSMSKKVKVRAAGVAGLLSTALLVAACGSSGATKTSNSGASKTSSSAAAPAAKSVASESAASTVTISSTSGPDGTYLTGAGGRALYLWMGDTKGKSNCSGECTTAWPPLTTKTAPKAEGVNASELGTIMREGGEMQVTYAGHPLYYYAGDNGAGTIEGQGSDAFGAKWWIVAPSGSAVTTGGSEESSGAAGAAGSEGSSGYEY